MTASVNGQPPHRTRQYCVNDRKRSARADATIGCALIGTTLSRVSDAASACSPAMISPLRQTIDRAPNAPRRSTRDNARTAISCKPVITLNANFTVDTGALARPRSVSLRPVPVGAGRVDQVRNPFVTASSAAFQRGSA